MLWILIMFVVGITLAILYEKLCLDALVEVTAIILIAISVAGVLMSPVIIHEGLGHTDVVSVRYTDGTVVRDDCSPIYLIRVDRKSYWDWDKDVRTYELKQRDQTLVGETKDKGKILAWFERPDGEFKF